jgi:dihydrofolate reductase
MANKVFVGTSLDGYIADRDGGLSFLETAPNPENSDFGYTTFMKTVDAVLMGRKTLETVLGFGVPWHYSKPVFVLSSTMKEIPEKLVGKIEIVSGDIRDVVNDLNMRGLNDLYIGGGQLIQTFLAIDMIDELIVTQVPILLGGGTSLYGNLADHQEFELVSSNTLVEALVQSHYNRIRKK